MCGGEEAYNGAIIVAKNRGARNTGKRAKRTITACSAVLLHVKLISEIIKPIN